MPAIGKRQASVPSPSSVHWMTSINCFLMKSMSAMRCSFEKVVGKKRHDTHQDVPRGADVTGVFLNSVPFLTG